MDKFVNLCYPLSSQSQLKGDHVCAYAQEVLSLGLLLMEFNNATEGDGFRILCCWHFFLPLFKDVEWTNYA